MFSQSNNPIFKTLPTRSYALTASDQEKGWMQTLESLGFRVIVETTEVLPPCRVTEVPGVCVLVQQWD